jgi:hypothetical protein
LRPEAPSRVESLFGAPDTFRLCYEGDPEQIVASKVTTELGDTPGVRSPVKAQRCDLFRVPEGALDSPSTVTLETRRTGSSQTRSEQVPLTARDLRWVPHGRVDVAGRMLFLAPLSAGYPNLFELHNALRYRFTPAFRVGGGLDARLGLHTVLLGTNAVLSTTVPIAARWVTHLDAEYLVGFSMRGLQSQGSDWMHGPSVVLALGHTARRFLGAPSIADAGSAGPLVSAEYMILPREQHAVWFLGAGFFVRYTP